jgi:hypothetical protein
VGRYWLIGAPLIIVFVVFVARTLLTSGNGMLRSATVLIGITGLIFLTFADIGGYFRARSFTAEKPIWRGATVAAPLLKRCAGAKEDKAGWSVFLKHLKEPRYRPVSISASSTELSRRR